MHTASFDDTVEHGSHAALSPPRHAMIMLSRCVRVAAVGVVAFALACADQSDPSQADPGTADPPMSARGVRATAVIIDSASGLATIGVDLQTNQLALGAYQGAISFDTAALTLVSADPPGDGGRFANASGTGVVRFAGFSTTGFQTRRAVLLRFAVKDWAATRRLSVELSTAGTVTGERLTGEAMQSSRTVIKSLEVAR